MLAPIHLESERMARIESTLERLTIATEANAAANKQNAEEIEAMRELGGVVMRNFLIMFMVSQVFLFALVGSTIYVDATSIRIEGGQ